MGTELAASQGALVKLFNEDLAREFRSMIMALVLSREWVGEQDLLAKEIERIAEEEFQHAKMIAGVIKRLGGRGTVSPLSATTCINAEAMFDLLCNYGAEQVRHYRERVEQCERLELEALAEEVREILRAEEDQEEILNAVARGRVGN